MYLCKTLNEYGFPLLYSISSKEDVFNFLKSIDLSKNGNLLKEKTFKNLFPELYCNLITFVNENSIISDWKFSRKLFHFLQNDYELKIGLCKVCGKKYARFENFNYGYHDYCSLQCSGKSLKRIEHIKETNLKKYGYENPLQSKKIRDKIKETNLEKYGCEFPLQSEYIRDKWKKTNLEKYGVEYSINSENSQNKIKQTNLKKYGVENVFQSEECKNKIKENNLEKYGVEYYTQTQECKNKIKNTNLEKYGVEYSINSENSKNKIKQTCIEKYGVENVFQSEEIKEKIKETCLEKYGVENYAQTNEFAKQHRKSIEYDGITFDSSWEVDVYKFCKENNIPCVYQPDISFEYEYEGKKHFYHPDFLINNQLYEVKGNHFFENDKMICPFDRSKDELFEAKHQCIKDNFVIFIREYDLNKIKNNINIF